MIYPNNNNNNNNYQMQVIKRNGVKETVYFDKIVHRIQKIAEKLNLNRVNSVLIAKDTIQGIYDGIHTRDLDFLASQKCAERIIDDPQYNYLAAGICISNLHKSTSDDFMKVVDALYKNTNKSLVSEQHYNFVKENIDRINQELNYDRDYMLDFFSIKTLENSYLLKEKNQDNKFKMIERPQHLWMRISLAIHINDIDKAMKSYRHMSNLEFTHASPTLFNAGTNRSQLSSCFLIYMADNIENIFKVISDAARISKWAGGIGISISDIRAKGSLINGTNGKSDGIVPLVRHINTLARYINQGGRRNGAIAVYICPWHADIIDFCKLKTRDGDENLKARDMFLALWISDLFMKRVENNADWSLMCPNQSRGLNSVYGDEFEKLYIKYENEGKYIKKVKAKDVWRAILDSQMETGIPYMLFKDHINKKSNQKNLGTIKSSNLCSEIVQFTNNEETAVCNLASICLPRFIENINGCKVYNFDRLCEVAQLVTENLDNVIDINFYPIEEAKNSNFKHRPIGIGVQGLADVFCMLDMPFDSDEAYEMNKKIFETIYYGAVKASNEIAIRKGPYSSFNGSPASEGKMQFHMWGLDESDLLMHWDWKTLIDSVKQFGLRNSLLTTVMPTASTSQIMCNQECVESFTTNLYSRSTLVGEYVIINKHLIEKLISLNLWNDHVKNEFLYDKGSIANIKSIPDDIKKIYRTAFEMKTKPILDHAIGRAPFIDQSQSMNIFMSKPNNGSLTSSHFYAWRNGLKTGMYYLRSQPATDPIQFGLDPKIIESIKMERSKNKIINKNNRKNDNDLYKKSRNESFMNACGDACGA